MACIDVNGGAVQSTGSAEVISGAMDGDVVTFGSSKADINIDVNGGAVQSIAVNGGAVQSIVGGGNVVVGEHNEARLVIQADVTLNGEVNRDIIHFTPGIAGKVTFSDGSSMEWDGQNMVDNTRNVVSSFISCSAEAQLFDYGHDFHPDGGGEGMLSVF